MIRLINASFVLWVAIVDPRWDVDNHSVHVLCQSDHGCESAFRKDLIKIPVIFNHSGFGIGDGGGGVDARPTDNDVIVSGGGTRSKDGFGPGFRVDNFRGSANGGGSELDLVGFAGLVEGASWNYNLNWN